MEQKLIKNTTVNIQELFDLNYQYFHYGFVNTPSQLDDLDYYINAILGGFIKTVFDKNIHKVFPYQQKVTDVIIPATESLP